MSPGEARLVAAVLVGVALCALRRFLLSLGAASLVVAMPRIQMIPSLFELAWTAAHLFVAMAVLGEARLAEAASAGFFPSVHLQLF